MHAYEQEIQSCGWTGGIPYWDWTIDAANPETFVHSPVFDTEYGFGGNGDYIPGNFSHPAPGLPVNPPWDVPDRSGGGCLEDGPFANLTVNLGPGSNLEYNPNCIRRDFAPESFKNMSGDAPVEEGMDQLDFGFFDRLTQSTFHSGVTGVLAVCMVR